MNPAEMAKAAQKRLAEFVNRSAGQHLRAMRQQLVRASKEPSK